MSEIIIQIAETQCGAVDDSGFQTSSLSYVEAKRERIKGEIKGYKLYDHGLEPIFEKVD